MNRSFAKPTMMDGLAATNSLRVPYVYTHATNPIYSRYHIIDSDTRLWSQINTLESEYTSVFSFFSYIATAHSRDYRFPNKDNINRVKNGIIATLWIWQILEYIARITANKHEISIINSHLLHNNATHANITVVHQNHHNYLFPRRVRRAL